MKRLIAGLFGLLLALSAVADDGAKVITAKGKFADVRDDLVAAIEQRGLVINFTAHVGDMLRRTGQDLGKTTRIYEQADVIEFCSATACARDDGSRSAQPGLLSLHYRRLHPCPESPAWCISPTGNIPGPLH